MYLPRNAPLWPTSKWAPPSGSTFGCELPWINPLIKSMAPHNLPIQESLNLVKLISLFSFRVCELPPPFTLCVSLFDGAVYNHPIVPTAFRPLLLCGHECTSVEGRKGTVLKKSNLGNAEQTQCSHLHEVLFQPTERLGGCLGPFSQITEYEFVCSPLGRLRQGFQTHKLWQVKG